jgi:hypothetical protein
LSERITSFNFEDKTLQAGVKEQGIKPKLCRSEMRMKELDRSTSLSLFLLLSLLLAPFSFWVLKLIVYQEQI